MPDAMTGESADIYKEIIREAYIEPIRSVVIVDDEFPTIEGLLASQYEKNVNGIPEPAWRWKGKVEDAQRVEKLLNICRKYSWTVDIYDGKNHSGNSDDDNEIKIAQHLHQSDLMILDYQLDGNDNDGDRAIEILRKLAANQHFNIVLIYTNAAIDEIFNNIILSLMPPDETLEYKESVADALEDWEDQKEDIHKLLREIVDLNIYLKYRNGGKTVLSSFIREPELDFLRDIYKKKPKKIKISPLDILNHLLYNIQEDLSERLYENGSNEIKWSKEEEWNWIRIDKLFLTVINKDVEADSLIDLLENILYRWQPDPHRLIISKMRAELDERGVILEDAVLENNLMQAGWFWENLRLHDKKEERKNKLSTVISNQWERLLDRMFTPVLEYAEKVIDYETSRWNNPVEGVLKHFDVNMENNEQHQKVLLNSNCHFCSKKPEGWHLTTGHVINIEKDYWICLTPACDLVPEQKSGGRYRALYPMMPFKAVRLHPFSRKEDALSKANSNICLFLKIEDEIKAFQFVPIYKPSANLDRPPANPVWEEMFADKCGKFEQDTKRLSIARLEWNNDKQEIRSTLHKAVIVSQLRYEYALNLLQRLSMTLSRIGLDFISLKTE